jgi:AcrR family transcriptional regulator
MTTSTTAQPGPRRPLRADAQRNRQRVLDEAERLFVAAGPSVRIEDVAAAAEVGVGTVCRHFPTKEDLLAAVQERMYELLVRDAEAALDDPDPVGSFATFAHRLADVQARRRAITMTAEGPPPVTSELRRRVRAAVGDVLRRAQAAGGVRDDVSAADVLLLFAGIAHVTTVAESLSEPLRRRMVVVMLDGLRPEGASTLPGRPLRPADLDRLRRPTSTGR